VSAEEVFGFCLLDVQLAAKRLADLRQFLSNSIPHALSFEVSALPALLGSL
jgi:hypothetical protein